MKLSFINFKFIIITYILILIIQFILLQKPIFNNNYINLKKNINYNLKNKEELEQYLNEQLDVRLKI
ncbi:hypothetical protein CPAV1605_225 [seawater metagenome]|uniref:Uncharacterized protein n=1 Tax=seawater metagenome TaxID=1561972 RepID=A0A5E8CGD9_9ZZZZ